MAPEFHETRMGRQFYERTVPELARQLERVADAMERRGPRPIEAEQSLVAAALEQIAREELGIETLEERRSDRLDFHEVGVVGLRRALARAYELGVGRTGASNH